MGFIIHQLDMEKVVRCIPLIINCLNLSVMLYLHKMFIRIFAVIERVNVKCKKTWARNQLNRGNNYVPGCSASIIIYVFNE